MANKQPNDDKPAEASPCYENPSKTTKCTPSVAEGDGRQNTKEEQRETFTNPTLHDVLLCWGEESQKNPGNIRFHEVSETFAARFNASTERIEKHSVAEDLAAAVLSWGGRFLDFSEKDSSWFVIDQKRARRKCQQELLRKTINIQATLNKERGEGKHPFWPTSLTSGIGARGISSSSSSSDTSASPYFMEEREKSRPRGTDSSDQRNGPKRSTPTDLCQTVDAPSDFILGSLHSSESISQMFLSNDPLAKLYASQSDGTIELPPLSAPGYDGINALSQEDDPGRETRRGRHQSSFLVDRLLQSVSSISQIFSSCDGAKEFFQSQSITDGNLPVPEVNVEVCHGTKASPDETKASGAISAQDIAMFVESKAADQAISTQDSAFAESKADDRSTPAQDIAATFAESTAADRALSAQDIASLAESLARSQEALIQKLLESVSRAQQSVILAQETPIADSATERIGWFASREWGNDLGPVQDVNFHQLFQETEGDPAKSNTTKRDRNAMTVRDNEETEGEPEKNNKTKRDWNALVMQNLQASIKKPDSLEAVAVDAIHPVAGGEGIPPTHFSHTTSAPTDRGETKAVGALDRTQKQSSVEEEEVGTPDENYGQPNVDKASTSARKTSSRLAGSSETDAEGRTQRTDEDEEVYTTDENNSCDQPKTPNKVEKSSASARKSNSRFKFVMPTENDVLLGRGGRTNNNPGNKKYLEVKNTMQTRYLAAEKQEKTTISQELVDIVHEWGGRFLKLETPKNRWYEIEEAAARRKCSQSLREVNTPEERAAKRARYQYDK